MACFLPRFPWGPWLRTAWVGLLLVLSGYYPRFTGVLHWLISSSVFQAANLVEGGDQITAILTLLLVPVTLLDPRRNHWQQPTGPVNRYRGFTARVFLVLVSLQLGLAIIAEGSLSFLAIGVPPPAPSWGGMLSEGRAYLTDAWWLPTFPGIALSLTVLASNMLGDWLRVFNDPTTRR